MKRNRCKKVLGKCCRAEKIGGGERYYRYFTAVWRGSTPFIEGVRTCHWEGQEEYPKGKPAKRRHLLLLNREERGLHKPSATFVGSILLV